MTKVYVVQGEHPYVPGRPLTVHATAASATGEAVSLLNIMLKDSDLEPDATPDNWKEWLAALQIERDNDCDVWITEIEVKP